MTRRTRSTASHGVNSFSRPLVTTRRSGSTMSPRSRDPELGLDHTTSTTSRSGNNICLDSIRFCPLPLSWLVFSLRSLQDFQMIKGLQDATARIWSLAWSANLLAVGGNDTQLRVYDAGQDSGAGLRWMSFVLRPGLLGANSCAEVESKRPCSNPIHTFIFPSVFPTGTHW